MHGSLDLSAALDYPVALLPLPGESFEKADTLGLAGRLTRARKHFAQLSRFKKQSLQMGLSWGNLRFSWELSVAENLLINTLILEAPGASPFFDRATVCGVLLEIFFVCFLFALCWRSTADFCICGQWFFDPLGKILFFSGRLLLLQLNCVEGQLTGFLANCCFQGLRALIHV